MEVLNTHFRNFLWVIHWYVYIVCNFIVYCSKFIFYELFVISYTTFQFGFVCSVILLSGCVVTNNLPPLHHRCNWRQPSLPIFYSSSLSNVDALYPASATVIIQYPHLSIPSHPSKKTPRANLSRLSDPKRSEQYSFYHLILSFIPISIPTPV